MSFPVKARLAVAALAASAATASVAGPSFASTTSHSPATATATATTGAANAVRAAAKQAPAVAVPIAPTITVSDGAIPVPAGSTVAPGTNLTIAVSGGSVPAGTLSYMLDLGDGAGSQPVLAPTQTHVYATAGPHTISAVTADGLGGLSAAKTLTFNVGTAKAVLRLSASTGTADATHRFTVTMNGSAATQPLGTTVSYAFSCGVGGPVVVPTGISTATCDFSTPGVYAVTLTVTDSGSPLTPSVTTANVTVGPWVAPVPPMPPNLAPFAAAAGQAPLTATADFSKVVVDRTAKKASVTYTIAWGDKQTTTYTGKAQAALPTHTYTTAGSYRITLTVNDGLGLATSVASIARQTIVTSAPHGATAVLRAAGTDRYDTGVLVSRHRWAAATATGVPATEHPSTVILATGSSFPDALAGVPFSAKVNGALLLTNPAGLSPEVETEITRILPAGQNKTVYILGGTAAVSPAVANRLTTLGYTVTRIAGVDRFDTSLRIAHAMGDPAHVVVARGDDFADALSAGPFAADIFSTPNPAGGADPAAIILSAGDTLDGPESAYVHNKLVTGQLVAVAIGGGAARALMGVPGIDPSSQTPNVAAIIGADRYDTSRMVAANFASTIPIGVATGLAFPDALTGGAYMTSVGGPLLLTDPLVESAPTAQAVLAVAGTTTEVDVFGGNAAIAPGIYDNLVAAVKGVRGNF